MLLRKRFGFPPVQWPRVMQYSNLGANKSDGRIVGTVTNWLHGKGFGFIEASGTQYFVHVNSLISKGDLVVGSEVVFDATEKDGKKRAINVASFSETAEGNASASRPNPNSKRRVSPPLWNFIHDDSQTNKLLRGALPSFMHQHSVASVRPLCEQDLLFEDDFQTLELDYFNMDEMESVPK